MGALLPLGEAHWFTGHPKPGASSNGPTVPTLKELLGRERNNSQRYTFFFKLGGQLDR